MSSPATTIALSLEPWMNAKNRFLDSLPKDADRTIFKDATAENIFYTASAGFQQHEMNSKTAKARKKFKPMLDSLEGYGKALDVLSQSYATALCPLWGGLRIVLHMALSYDAYFEKILKMYERIGDLLPRFRSYQSLFPACPHLLTYLTDAYFEIVKFSYDASQVFVLPKNMPNKVAESSLKPKWKPFKLRFEECIESLRRATESVHQQAEIAFMQESKAHMIESQKFQDLILSDRSLQKSQDELRCIKDLLSTYDYRLKHEGIQSSRCEGTCSWFLESEEVITWLGSDTTEPFCCFGIPGSGKSVIASYVIDSVLGGTMNCTQDAPALVCYHYCDYGNDVTLDATKIIASIVRQILDPGSPCAPGIMNRCRDALRLGLSLSRNDTVHCLEEALRTAPQMLIVIDGIDEMNEQNQDALLDELLSKLPRFRKTAKVMLFGRRNERVVQRHLRNAPSITISADHNAGDLVKYVEAELQSRIDNGDLVIDSEDMADAIVERLITGAEHMFLWARFQIEELCYADTEAAMWEILDNLPRTLTETYDRIVRRIAKAPRGEYMIALAKNVLVWITTAVRPLTMDELREAVAIRSQDKSLERQRVIKDNVHILEACSNLVAVANDSTLRLAHHTVKDYIHAGAEEVVGFREDRLSEQYPFQVLHFDYEDAQVAIAKRCLAYLQFTDFAVQVVKSSHVDFSTSSDKFGKRLISSVTDKRDNKLVSFLTLARGESSRTTRQVKLKLPSRVQNQGQTIAQQFMMSQYVSQYWHQHFHSVWSLQRGSLDLTPGKVLLFSHQSSLKFRPWWTSYLPGQPSVAFDRKLVDWAVDLDYPVFLQFLQENSNDRELVSDYWRNASWQALTVNHVDDQLYWDYLVTRACRAGSEQVLLWLAMEFSGMYTWSENLFKHIAMTELLAALDFPNFGAVMDECLIPAYDKTKPGILDTSHVVADLLRAQDLPALKKFVLWTRTSQHATIFPRDELLAAVKTSDPANVACVCSAIVESGRKFEADRRNWFSAIQVCIDDRKEYCLTALLPLHVFEHETRLYRSSLMSAILEEKNVSQLPWLRPLLQGYPELMPQEGPQYGRVSL